MMDGEGVQQNLMLEKKIAAREAVIGIVGLGYVGLPLARAVNRAGFPILGFDTDIAKVALLNQGGSPIGSVSGEEIR